MTKPLAVAIDGPSGAGKSTIARILARELQFLYVDTGALYRTVGYHALQCGADPSDAAAVEPLLEGLRVELRYIDGMTFEAIAEKTCYSIRQTLRRHALALDAMQWEDAV